MRLPLVIGGLPVIPIDFSEPLATIAMRALSLLGTIPLVALAAFTLVLVLFWRRQKTRIMLLVLTVGGGELISLLLKWLFVRPRPRWPDPLVVLTTSSFPSGHAMRSVLFYGILIYFLLPRIGSWLGRVSILLTGGLVLMVGASRIYLGVHGLSDVLSGYAAGLAWLGCVVVGVKIIQRTWQNHIGTSLDDKYPSGAR